MEDFILQMLKKNYSTNIESVEFLRQGGCTSYLVTENSKKYFLKAVGKAFFDTVKQSIDIMLFLCGQGFPVPQIILTAEGKPYVSDESMETLYVLYEFIEGIEPDINADAEKIGELVGKLHLLMKQYTYKLIFRDKAFFINRYIEILRKKQYPNDKLAEYIAIGDTLWDRVSDLPKSFCHGDLHRGNLLQTSDNRIYLLDFDTSCLAPRMFDVMVMCDTTDYFKFDPNDYKNTMLIYNRFLKGYEKYNALSESEKKAFHDFVAIRHYQLQATIVEIYGIDCIDEQFIDNQLEWIKNWIRLG